MTPWLILIPLLAWFALLAWLVSGSGEQQAYLNRAREVLDELDIRADLDSVLRESSHDAVLPYLPASVRDDFDPVVQRRLVDEEKRERMFVDKRGRHRETMMDEYVARKLAEASPRPRQLS